MVQYALNPKPCLDVKMGNLCALMLEGKYFTSKLQSETYQFCYPETYN